MITVACEKPAVQPETASTHAQQVHLAAWMETMPEGNFISTSTDEAWKKNHADGFYYVPGSEVGYNVECVALEGPFIFIPRVARV